MISYRKQSRFLRGSTPSVSSENGTSWETMPLLLLGREVGNHLAVLRIHVCT